MSMECKSINTAGSQSKSSLDKGSEPSVHTVSESGWRCKIMYKSMYNKSFQAPPDMHSIETSIHCSPVHETSADIHVHSLFLISWIKTEAEPQ